MRNASNPPEAAPSKRAVPWLTLIATTFVLPTLQTCHDGPFHSPAYYAADGASALWIAPPFLVAAILAFLSARSLWRGEVDLRSRHVALGSVAVLWVSVAVTVGLFISKPLEDLPWLLGGLAALAGSVVIIRSGRARTPWQVWDRLIAAYALTAAVSGPTCILFDDLFGTARDELGPGAYLYLGALGILLILSLGAVVRSSRAATTPPRR